MIYPHSPVRDGLAQLDEGNFVESLPTGSPTLRAFAAWGFFAESWWLLACGLAKSRPARCASSPGRGWVAGVRARLSLAGGRDALRTAAETAALRERGIYSLLALSCRLAYRCPGESVSSRHMTVVATAWLIAYLWLARSRAARALAPAGFPIVAGPWPGFRSSTRRRRKQRRRRG